MKRSVGASMCTTPEFGKLLADRRLKTLDDGGARIKSLQIR
jgi:hypothetical protein